MREAPLASRSTEQLISHLRIYTRSLGVLRLLASVVFLLGVVMLVMPVHLEALVLPVRFCAVLGIFASIAVILHCRSMAVLAEYIRRLERDQKEE